MDNQQFISDLHKIECNAGKLPKNTKKQAQMSISKYQIKKARIQMARCKLLYKPSNQICAPKTPYEAVMLNRCDELYSPREFINAFYGALKLHRERIDLDSMIKEAKESRYKHFNKGDK